MCRVGLSYLQKRTFHDKRRCITSTIGTFFTQTTQAKGAYVHSALSKAGGLGPHFALESEWQAKGIVFIFHLPGSIDLQKMLH